MSHIYDNWERLVAATIKKQQLWELFHSHSRTPSTLSQASSYSDVSFNAESPSINVDMAAATSSSAIIHMNEELVELRKFLRANSILYKEDKNEVEAPPIPAKNYSSQLLYDYLAAVDEIINLITTESNIRSDENKGQAEKILEQAMTRLEAEFGSILNTVPLDPDRLNQFLSYDDSSVDAISTRAVYNGEVGLVHVELSRSDAVIKLREIAARMIRAGYEREHCRVYSRIRQEALDEFIVNILGSDERFRSTKGFQTFFNNKIRKWIKAVKVVVRCLLLSEKRLCEQIFTESDLLKEVCFLETSKGCVMQLLNFGEAIAIGKRPAEKLFSILDMYEALSEVLPDLQSLFMDDDAGYMVCSEAKRVLYVLGEAAIGTFVEFENEVQGTALRNPIPNGEIHPLARYVVNYVMLLVEYSDTLSTLDTFLENMESESGTPKTDNHNTDGERISLIAQHLLALISSLESNMEKFSRTYEDSAMRYIFLMNNILYIVQKVKDSDSRKLLGDNWIKERRGMIRLYSRHYLRASWSKALLCLKDEEIGGSSNIVSKVALRESFKDFNSCFEDNYRIQTAWNVPDAQFREELRISIMEKVIPAYRLFMGRFGSILESGRHGTGKYIKYTPEDLENYSSDLFEGTPLVLEQGKQMRPAPRLPPRGILISRLGKKFLSIVRLNP